jgi:hypothetical protein
MSSDSSARELPNSSLQNIPNCFGTGPPSASKKAKAERHSHAQEVPERSKCASEPVLLTTVV